MCDHGDQDTRLCAEYSMSMWCLFFVSMPARWCKSRHARWRYFLDAGRCIWEWSPNLARLMNKIDLMSGIGEDIHGQSDQSGPVWLCHCWRGVSRLLLGESPEWGPVDEGVGAGGMSLISYLKGFSYEIIKSNCELNLEKMSLVGQISLKKE